MPYYDKMDINMNYNLTVGDYTPELSYKIEQKKALHVSKAANQQVPMRLTSGNNKVFPTHVSNEESIINIQLSYDLQVPMEWIVSPHFTPWLDRALCIGH